MMVWSLTIPLALFLRRNINVLEGLYLCNALNVQFVVKHTNGVPTRQRVELSSLAILSNAPGLKLTVFLR